MAMQCAIAYIQGDKTCFLQKKSAILAATLDFFQASLMGKESLWPPSCMLIIHSIPLTVGIGPLVWDFGLAPCIMWDGPQSIVGFHHTTEIMSTKSPGKLPIQTSKGTF